MDIGSIEKSVINNLSDGAFNDLLINPVYVACLVTIVVLLIVICMYNENRLVKTGFYILLASLTIIFSHNKLLLKEHKRQLCGKDTVNICSTIGAGPVNSSTAGGLEERLSYLDDI